MKPETEPSEAIRSLIHELRTCRTFDYPEVMAKAADLIERLLARENLREEAQTIGWPDEAREAWRALNRLKIAADDALAEERRGRAAAIREAGKP